MIPRAIEAATGGRGLQVFGDDYPTPDGTCLRDYVHVTDLADAHVRALEVIVDTRKSGVYSPRRTQGTALSSHGAPRPWFASGKARASPTDCVSVTASAKPM